MKKIFFLVFSILAFVPKMQSQRATVASGGVATGAGGTVSYSVGQVAYKTQTGTNGVVTQGVQQPFEIVTLSGEEFTTISLEAAVYPNPTVSIVNLNIKNYPIENLSYQLFDIRGRLINDNKIFNQETVIDLERFPIATYLLKVTSNNKELKTFKIIKN